MYEGFSLYGDLFKRLPLYYKTSFSTFRESLLALIHTRTWVNPSLIRFVASKEGSISLYRVVLSAKWIILRFESDFIFFFIEVHLFFICVLCFLVIFIFEFGHLTVLIKFSRWAQRWPVLCGYVIAACCGPYGGSVWLPGCFQEA